MTEMNGKKCFCVVRTEITTITEVYLVDVVQDRGYPTLKDLAITASLNNNPIGATTEKTLNFKVMEKEE